MLRYPLVALMLTAASIGVTTAVQAQETPPPVIVTPPPPAPVLVTPPSEQPPEPAPILVITQPRPRNMSISVGGGASNFFENKLENRTGVQGAYDARITFGASSPLAAEAAYVGTAGNIDSLGLDNDAMLISNGVEGLARLNLVTNEDFQPFIVGGGSWVRYDIVNASFNTSDMRDSDDVLAIPVGAGIAGYLGDSGMMLDARFVYRATFDDELAGKTKMNNWMATLRLGYTF